MTRRLRGLSLLAASAALAAGALPATASAGKKDRVKHYSVADAQWLQSAIEGDRYEIAGGLLAQRLGSTQDVKGYGARLVQDHTASLADALKLARKLHIQVPKAASPQEQAVLDLLSGLAGPAFDSAFADTEAKDHQQDISEAQDERDRGFNLRIRKAAIRELPTLKAHLAIAEDLGGHQGTDPTP